MYHFAAMALSILMVTGPASALDLGVGVQAGGLGIGADAGAGPKGTTVGIGASLGSVGGVNTGASVGGGRLDGASGGTMAGNGNESSPTAAASSAAGGAATSATGTMGRAPSASRSKAGVANSASFAPAKGLEYSITLPWNLRPSRGSERSAVAMEQNVLPGTPTAVVSACRAAIEAAASPFGMLSVRARSAGTLRRLRDGNVSAPLRVRIEYARQGGAEIRQALVRCHLDAKGRVTDLT